MSRVLLGMLAVLVIAVAMWTSLQQVDTADRAAAEDTADAPRYYIKNAAWTMLGPSGTPEYRMRAELAEYFDDQSARLSQLRDDDLAGEQVWTISAPSGYAPPHQRRMLLNGPITANGQWADGQQFQLDTDHMWIDTLRRELYTDAEVLLTSALRRIQARGLRADWRGDSLQLLDQVSVRYETR